MDYWQAVAQMVRHAVQVRVMLQQALVLPAARLNPAIPATHAILVVLMQVMHMVVGIDLEFSPRLGLTVPT